MNSSRFRVATTCLVLLLSACGLERPERLLSPPAEAVVGRPSDGLLQSPRLQAVVDLQVARDADALTDLLTDADAVVRARAAFALASVIDGIAAPTLLRSLEDSEAAVRRDGAFALGQYDSSALEPILNSATPARGGVLQMLRALTDADNAARIADEVQSVDGEGRDERIARAAVEIADRLGAHMLGEFEGEGDAAVRTQLLEAASKVGGSRTLGAVLLVSPLDEMDRGNVALSLGYLFRRGFRSEEAVAREAQYLQDPVARVRLHAAYGIASIQEPLIWRPQLAAVRAIMDGWSLDEPAAEMMMSGIEGSLLTDDHPRILRYLADGSDWRTRAQAAEALKGWELYVDERAALFVALSDPSYHVRVSAAEGLTNSPPSPAWVRDLMTWINENPDSRIVQGHLMKAFVMGGAYQYVFDWVNQFSTSEVLPWTLTLAALDQSAGPPVLDLFARAARSEHRSLAVPATRHLVERWKGSRGLTSAQQQFYEALKGAFETGDPERMAIAASALRDPLLMESRPDVLGDYEASPERILSGPIEVDWHALAELGRHPRLVMDTDRGRIVLTLDTEEAPLTVQWMTRFASEGRFDGVPFHRVEQDFVIQGGDLGLSDQGGSILFGMMTEATQIPFVRGTLGMARSARRHSESTEFFVNHTLAPHLNGGYTAWGWVSEGMDVVDRIQRLDLIQHAWVIPDPS